jgi:hypothetical protein
MTTKLKTLLKTTAAVATVFAGSQTWGSGDLKLASIDSTGVLGTGHLSAGSPAGSISGIILAPEKNAVISQSGTGPVAQISAGGIVCPGSTLTLDLADSGSGIFNLFAMKDLDVYIRSATSGNTLAAFTIANVILGEKASRVRFWTSDIALLTVTNVKKDARFDRDADDTVTKVDVPTPAPEVTLGGRKYILVQHNSVN